MVINRRTYTVYPGQFREALTLMKEIQTHTRKEFNRDFKILVALYGPLGTIVIEFEYADTAEQEAFSNVWYPSLEAKGWIRQWFQFVQTGSSELWTDSREPDPFKKESTS